MIRPGKWVYGKGFVVDGAPANDNSSSTASAAASSAPALNTIEGQFEEMRRRRNEAAGLGMDDQWLGLDQAFHFSRAPDIDKKCELENL